VTSRHSDQSEIQWQIRVPIFKDPVILRQLGLALGFPFGLLAVLFAILSFWSRGALYGLGLVGLLMLLTWLFVMVVYGGKYDAEFVLDDKGVACRTQSGQARKNRVINSLAVGLGLLAGKPGVAGAGLLAASRQQVFIRWNRIRKARYNPRARTILIWGGFAEHIALFCTAENYAIVEQSIKQKSGHS
jgi:hypothetical protein